MFSRSLRRKLARAAWWFTATVTAAFIGIGTVIVMEPLVPRTHTIYADLGGSVYGKYEEYAREAARGDSFRIDGLCVSACTMLLGIVPDDHICTTFRGKFGFHAAFRTLPGPEGFGMRIFSHEATDLLWTLYPSKVTDYLKAHGWSGPDKDQPDLIWMEAWRAGVKPCGQIVFRRPVTPFTRS